jgi:hypothetical protein
MPHETSQSYSQVRIIRLVFLVGLSSVVLAGADIVAGHTFVSALTEMMELLVWLPFFPFSAMVDCLFILNFY